jgi:predicted phage terminase large subunit-like protein
MPDAPQSVAEFSDARCAEIFAVALPARKLGPDMANGDQSFALRLARRIAQVRLRWFIAYVTADDLEAYQFDAFHESVIADLQAVFDGTERRLLISAPPRHGKSRLCAILFPAFLVGARPTEKLIVASYSLELSREHVRACRGVMLAPAYAEIFPGTTLADDGQASDLLRTPQDGFIRGTGAGGLLTGLGAHLILDDLVKGQEEADSELMRSTLWNWYATSARTRLPPNGFIVGIGTRWRYNDILGRLIASSDDASGERWTHRNYPALDEEGRALWPARFDEPAVRALKVTLGVSQFQALYQGRPTAATGDFFRDAWFRYYRPQDLAPERELNTVICSDLALTPSGGDYSVFVVVSIAPSSDLFVRTLWRQRVAIDDSLNALIALCSKYRPSAWIYENDNIMQSVLPWARQRLKRANLPLWHICLTRQASKAAKAGSLQGLAQERGVYLPDEALWLEAFLAEMLSFPFGAHDDQADALAHVGRAWPKLRARTVPRDDGSDPAFAAVPYDPAKPFGGNVRLNDLWQQSRAPAYRRI